MQEMQQQQIKIELGQKEAEGIYANLVMITHSPTEMIIDFARVMPRMPKARVQSRIIMTPMHAKMLLHALTENIKKFEKQYGEIKLHSGAQMPSKNIGFESNINNEGQEK